MSPVLLDPGGEVPSSYPDVNLAAFTRNGVCSGVTGWMFVLVDVEKGL